MYSDDNQPSTGIQHKPRSFKRGYVCEESTSVDIMHLLSSWISPLATCDYTASAQQAAHCHSVSLNEMGAGSAYTRTQESSCVWWYENRDSPGRPQPAPTGADDLGSQKARDVGNLWLRSYLQYSAKQGLFQGLPLWLSLAKRLLIYQQLVHSASAAPSRPPSHGEGQAT